MTPQERETKWRRWPQGDAGDAVDFACDHAKEPIFFLEDWRAGRADEWPEYMRWLNVQREGARAASGMSAGTAETQSGSGQKPASPTAAPSGGDAHTPPPSERGSGD